MTIAASHAPARAGSALVIALCFCVAVLEGYDIQAVGVVARKLARALALRPDQMGAIFAVSNVGLILGAGIGGWLADRVGRRPVLAASVAAFGLFTVATMLADGFGGLFLARFLAGLGFGGAIPNLMALSTEVSTPQRRALTASAMFCGMPLGGAASALFTQSLPPDFDWRIVFLVGGLAPLALAPALLLLMPETRRAIPAQARPPILDALFGAGRAAPTLLIWASLLPTLLILYLLLNWLPTLAVEKGLSEAAAPQSALAFNLASVVGALLFGALVDRVGMRWPFALWFAGLTATLLALAATQGAALRVLALSGAAGFFLLGAQYALFGIAASCYPSAVRATGAGAATAMGRLGSIAGPLAAGVLLAAGMTSSQMLATLAPLAAFAGATIVALSFFNRAE